MSSELPPIPPTSAHHNHLRLVRNMAVEGVVRLSDAAEQIQSLAYQALVLFEEASRYEQEVRGLPEPIPGRMPKPLEV